MALMSRKLQHQQPVGIKSSQTLLTGSSKLHQQIFRQKMMKMAVIKEQTDEYSVLTPPVNDSDVSFSN